MASATLEIQLLGDFQIRVEDRVIPADAWKLRKAAGIVKLLALEPGHRLHREQIMDVLWPDLETDAAANNLRGTLHAARKIVDVADVLRREGHHIVLADLTSVRVDVHAFEAAVDTAWRGRDPAAYRTAIERYPGDLLPDDPYEEWIDTRRTALRTSYLAVITGLARLYEDIEDVDRAVDTWRQVISAEVIHEEAHTRLMLLYAKLGQRQDALAQYALLVTSLERELCIEPEPVTRQLADAIRSGTLGESRPATAATPRQRNNLPAQITDLLGRERETAEIRHILSGGRCVTVTGPGGAGKTQLAIRVARQLVNDYPDGVFLVQLAPVSQAELVVTTIARTLDIAESSSKAPVEALIQYVADRSILLVLDNFEHVIPVASIVRQLLEAAPRLTVLTTSRVPLRLRGERLYPLRALTEDASVALFVQRSQDVHPVFAPVEQDLQVIQEICQKLDGLPLAIELAAARSNVLTPQALLTRLDHPLSVLTSGPRDLPDRQQTLRATIDWSYQLLQPDAQVLFRRLALFRGGWALEAAEAVCPTSFDALSLLSTLVDSSLVEQAKQADLEPRFRMLETIREFGIEQLEASEDEGAARQAHAYYFAKLVASAPRFLIGPEQPIWLDRFELEHANIRDSLDYLFTQDVEAGLSLLAVLWRFWWTRGHLTIGLQYFNRYLEAIDDTINPLLLARVLTGAGAIVEYASSLEWDRAEALHHQALSVWLDIPSAPEGAYWSYLCLGNIALRKADLNRARAFYDEAIAYAERNNQVLGKLGGFLLIGNLYANSHNHTEAEYYFDLSLSIARAIGDPWTTSMNTHNLGLLHLNEGRYDEARPLIAEALAINRRLVHHRDIAPGLIALGWIDLYKGDIESCIELFEEGYGIALLSGDSRSIGSSLYGIASVAMVQGHTSRALDLYHQSLFRFHAAGEPVGISDALEGLAGAYTLAGDLDYATMMFAAASAYRQRVGVSSNDITRLDTSAHLTTLRETLARLRFNAAWEAGISLTPEQILADERSGTRS